MFPELDWVPALFVLAGVGLLSLAGGLVWFVWWLIHHISVVVT